VEITTDVRSCNCTVTARVLFQDNVIAKEVFTLSYVTLFLRSPETQNRKLALLYKRAKKWAEKRQSIEVNNRQTLLVTQAVPVA
jgi:hypothetical protein